MKKNIKKTKKFKFIEKYRKEYVLSPKEKLFCEEYLKSNSASIDAVYKSGYKPKNRQAAIKMFDELLSRPNILQFIYLKMKKGNSHNNAMKHLLFLINQNIDLNKKASAINKYYRITGKYRKTKRK